MTQKIVNNEFIGDVYIKPSNVLSHVSIDLKFIDEFIESDHFDIDRFLPMAEIYKEQLPKNVTDPKEQVWWYLFLQLVGPEENEKCVKIYEEAWQNEN